MSDSLDALAGRVDAALAKYLQIQACWDARDAAEQAQHTAETELHVKLRAGDADYPGEYTILPHGAPKVRIAGQFTILESDPDYQTVRSAERAYRNAQQNYESALQAKAPGGWEFQRYESYDAPDFLSLADVERWLSESLTVLRAERELGIDGQLLAESAGRSVRNFVSALDHLRVNDRPTLPTPTGIHDAEIAVSGLRAWVRDRLDALEPATKDVCDAARDVVALRRFVTLTWNQITAPYEHLDEQSEFYARSKVELEVVAHFIESFGAIVRPIAKRYWPAFENEPKRPSDPPAEKVFYRNGEPSYDRQDRALVLFGTDDRYRAGLRCLLWGAVGKSPPEFGAVEDVQRHIKHWALNLVVPRLPPLGLRRGNPPVWRSQELPLEWAADAAKRLFEESLVARVPDRRLPDSLVQLAAAITANDTELRVMREADVERAQARKAMDQAATQAYHDRNIEADDFPAWERNIVAFAESCKAAEHAEALTESIKYFAERPNDVEQFAAAIVQEAVERPNSGAAADLLTLASNRGFIKAVRGAFQIICSRATQPRRVTGQPTTLQSAVQPPANGTSEKGEGAGKSRAEILKSLSLCVRQAYLTYQFAETKNGKRLEDQEAYDYLYEYGLPDNAGDLGELCDYELPVFDTWVRYLRDARRPLGEQKYTRRANRPKGRSIANADQVASPERDV